MSASPAIAMSAAFGTTALWPRSSMRFDTRGATKNMQTAISDDALVASSAEAPASVSVVIVPIVVVYENSRMSSAPASNRYAARVRRIAEYVPVFPMRKCHTTHPKQMSKAASRKAGSRYSCSLLKVRSVFSGRAGSWYSTQALADHVIPTRQFVIT